MPPKAPYGYVKDPDNKDFWIIDEEAAGVVRLIFRLFLDGKNRNQIAVYLTQAQIPTPTFYMKERGRGTCKNRALNEDNRYKWKQSHFDPYPYTAGVLRRCSQLQDYKAFPGQGEPLCRPEPMADNRKWLHEPIIDRADFETAQRILENAAPSDAPTGTGKSTLCRACFSVRIAAQKCTSA